MDEDNCIKRQAVVVIHGIGEQRPMETLRGFVKGIKSVLEKVDPAEKNSTVRSKPDSVGDIYETVKLSMDSTRRRPITDFYEFYWAHNMRGNQFRHMVTWIIRLVFTPVKKTPPRLQKLWWTIWALFLLFLSFSVYFSTGTNFSTIKRILAPITAIALFPLILSIAGIITKAFFLNYAGDAARYFTPDPDNIAERSRIRQQGIAFLEKLHQIQRGIKVDRIIIVSHSLGTVIAYDLMRLLWTEYNTKFVPSLNIDQTHLKQLDKFQLNGSAENLDKFMNLQHATWVEQKQNGNPWLISDFITLGSALNAADYFISSQEPFETLVQQREMPTCPPLQDEDDHSMVYKSYPPFEIEGKKRSIYLLNWSALFATIRWTNIYFTSDYIGGPMQRKFGKGIKDIEVDRKSLWFFPGGHTSYWDEGDANNALEHIVKALQLHSNQ